MARANVRLLAPQAARLTRLLRTGYFPAELPPPFTTQPFARIARRLHREWAPDDILTFRSTPEHYNIPRYSQARRKLSIVNPVNQFEVSRIISQNWAAIQARSARSGISEFRPEISASLGGRAIVGVDFDGVSRRRAEILARYGRYVKTDIARFYASIYTHSVAWALLGKEWVKQNYRTPDFRASFANRLDRAISAGQAGQTVGIPIGPDTSRILSELIATEVDQEIAQVIPDLTDRAVRYVDDLIVGLRETETQEAILSHVSTALYEYELELNAEKTTIHGIGYPHAPEWSHYIRNFELSTRAGRQREDLDSFFEQAAYLAEQNPRENVMLFAARRAASFTLDQSCFFHFVRWLMYSARRSSTCLSFVVEHISFLHRSGSNLPLEEIREFIGIQLPAKADAAHTAEVCWLLFWAREMNITLDAATLSQICRLRSSVVALLVMDLSQRGLVAGGIDDSFWRSFVSSSGLQSEMWLVVYEATNKGWWSRRRSNTFIANHNFFGVLLEEDVEFYETGRRARPQAGPSFFAMLGRMAGAGAGAGGYPF